MSALVTICYILGINLFCSFLLSLIVYIRSQKYYGPLIKMDKDNKPIDLHKKYDAFHPHDKVSFFQLWFGAFFCFFFKIFFTLFIVTVGYWNLRLVYACYKDCDTNPEHRKKIKNAITFWSWLFLLANGVRIGKKFPEYEKVYKKYLGEDYNFENDKYSLIISNHIGFFEVVISMALYAPGFVSKSSVRNYWFIGPISQCLNCLYVDRENENDKQKIFESLLSRQSSFYEDKYLAPLVIFPEGTCSCGRNVLRFKKGAFYSLLPIKPQIVSVDQTKKFHLSVGASNVILHYFKNLCHFINTIYVAVLPTIRPTDYMFENYKNFGKEKWQIYSKVARKIYSEVGNLEETDMGYRDLARYIKAMRTGFYDPNENMDYENRDKEKNNIDDKKNEILEINTTNEEDKINNPEENKENDEKNEFKDSSYKEIIKEDNNDNDNNNENNNDNDSNNDNNPKMGNDDNNLNYDNDNNNKFKEKLLNN